MATKRLRYEWLDLVKDPIHIPITITIEDNNIFNWTINMFITDNTNTIVDTIKFSLLFPTDYPLKAPKFFTQNKNYRWFQLQIQSSWNPAGGVRSILAHISSELTEYLSTGTCEVLKCLF